MSMPDYTVVFDGGSKGNPGPGYGSYAIYVGERRQFTRIEEEYGDRMTSNEAEYQALQSAMQRLLEMLEARKADPAQTVVEVFGDSLLVIMQMSGRWKVRNERMRQRRDAALALASMFKRVTYMHQDRSESFALFGH